MEKKEIKLFTISLIGGILGGALVMTLTGSLSFFNFRSSNSSLNSQQKNLLPQPEEQVPSLDSCKASIQKLCPGLTLDSIGLQCLKIQSKSLEGECRKAVLFRYKKWDVCAKELQDYCPEGTVEAGRARECLEKTKKKLSQDCLAAFEKPE